MNPIIQKQNCDPLENDDEDEIGAGQRELPPSYSNVLLEEHLKSARIFRDLYPPDLLNAIKSFMFHPTLPPPHPHRTYHSLRDRSYPDGDGSYFGEIDPKLRRSGYGHMVYSNGDSYQGFWKKQEKSGIGSYFWAQSGSLYFGQWQNGERHGSGKFVLGPRRKESAGGRVIITGAWYKGRVKNSKENKATLYVKEGEDEIQVVTENLSRVL